MYKLKEFEMKQPLPPGTGGWKTRISLRFPNDLDPDRNEAISDRVNKCINWFMTTLAFVVSEETEKGVNARAKLWKFEKALSDIDKMVEKL